MAPSPVDSSSHLNSIKMFLDREACLPGDSRLLSW